MPLLARDMFPGAAVEAWELTPRVGGFVHKVCFFKTRKDLRFAWKRVREMRGDTGRFEAMGNCRGFVHQCWEVREKPFQKPRMVVDPRFASIICLLVPELDLEVCAHEALHAGMAHVRRLKRDPLMVAVDMEDEEDVAYPTGWIASQIIRIAQREGWL